MHSLRLAVCVALGATLLGCSSGPADPAPRLHRPPDRQISATASQGVIATVSPQATDIGIEVMRQGGNAIDGAIAAALALGVVDGYNSGIGGGCFMLIRLRDGSFVALDGREIAPAAATRDMYIRNGQADTSLSQTGALASGVPGSLAVYEYAIKHFGAKRLAEVIEPAAKVAEEGFICTPNFERRIAGQLENLKKFPGSAEIFVKPDGNGYTAGERIVQTDLARTYRGIAEYGSDYFYRGAVAEKAAAWMRENGGILTREDFANYRLKHREPLVSTYRGYTIVGFPPPSSGGVHVAQIFNILENFNVNHLHFDKPVDRIHVISEAMKLAFADRAQWLGDPDFANVPRGLVDKSYAKELASKISMDRALTDVDYGTPPKHESDFFGRHTTHIAAADAEGNWVAITTTVNTSFGSKVIVPGTGVILNNQMDDFAVQPGVPNHFGLIGNEANAVAPGKRPLSSMSPTIILKDNQPIMTVGAAGGPKIITQALLVMSNVLDLGDDLETAMKRPRFHHQWKPPTLWIERTFPADVLNSLKERGHVMEIVSPSGATQAVVRNPDGSLTAAHEPRLSGKAGGN